jgi:hypothetical protein
MTDSTAQARPGRKPKGSVPDKPDPSHVLTWRQRKVLQVDAVAGNTRGEGGEATPGSRELITSLASRRAESGPSRAEVARRMRTSQAAVARLEAQFSTLARYTEALGLLAAGAGAGISARRARLHPIAGRRTCAR